MPASAQDAFDAFHHHAWRSRWDSLAPAASIDGGLECPRVGAVSSNPGAGWLSALSMRTKFIAYEPGSLAAATMVGASFPFKSWAASMRHRDSRGGGSTLSYVYSFRVGPAWMAPLLDPVVDWAFERQTRKRFARLARFLAAHAGEIQAWRRARQASPATP